MSDRPFLDKATPPAPDTLATALGDAAPRWDRLKQALASDHAPLTEAWSYGGKAYGWSLRLLQKKRTVGYLLPLRGTFVAAFALGDEACARATDAGLPDEVVAAIAAAPRQLEGRGVRVEVASDADLVTARRLAALRAGR